MATNNFYFLLLSLCNVVLALSESPVSCYKIEPGTVAGIISVDIILTLLIVAVTYHCARNQQQRATKVEKVYMNVRAKCKT
ncbi:hematopoietic cell signal transducer isoform X2 [Periophthalmus magnuspinnatus]|uniref:hematopoietic cell signal transducer isoform X2 n=1 Tax=Periophthalmus magnuspinnatus TaxID=409849 RepID=UPI00145AE5CB|nr:hematopoietic cell signal transducer isoform X2 [Periophthalmus magnuspinnatus]